MNLMRLYSAEAPRIRAKKPSSLTITGIENRGDIRSMLVDLSRVSMEKCACLPRPASTIYTTGGNYFYQIPTDKKTSRSVFLTVLVLAKILVYLRNQILCAKISE